MARKSFSVLFFIKKGKLLKNGEAPVCMRITVNGCMVDINRKTLCIPLNKTICDFVQYLTKYDLY